MNREYINDKDAIMPIGSIARSLGVHVRTLRIYDEAGILPPSRVTNKRRYYSIKDADKARLILFLTRSLSINITGVKIILAMLKKAKIAPSKQYAYIKKMSELADFSESFLEENYEKNSRKGRKSNASKGIS